MVSVAAKMTKKDTIEIPKNRSKVDKNRVFLPYLVFCSKKFLNFRSFKKF